MNTINWIRNPETGEYKSDCGRFRIWYDRCRPVKRGRWVVVDRETKDPVTPEFNMIRCNETLRSCQGQAVRWKAGKN